MKIAFDQSSADMVDIDILALGKTDSHSEN